MTSIQIDLKDGLSSSTAVKGPCRVATTANITLSGEQTIDGVAVVTDDRVLVKDQTTGADNGIWICDTGAWRRSKDFNKTKDVASGTQIWVNSGATNQGLWRLSTVDPIAVGTTNIAFARSMLASSNNLGDVADKVAALGNLNYQRVAGNSTYAIMSAPTKMSQQADLRDWNGLDLTGVNDNATLFQAALNAMAPSGEPLYVPAGVVALGSTITWPVGGHIRGAGMPGATNEGTIPYSKYTTLHFTHSGIGMQTLQSQTQYGGRTIRDLCTKRTQPAFGVGWAPADIDYDFDIRNASDTVMENLLLTNPTKGIQLIGGGGRHRLRNIAGQPLYIGINATQQYDVDYIDNIHFWPYWTHDANVASWMVNNASMLRLGRLDNAAIGEVFGWGYVLGMSLYVQATEGSLPGGGVALLNMKRLAVDHCHTGLLINAGHDSPVLNIEEIYAVQSSPDLASAPLININCNNAKLTLGKFYGARTQSAAIAIAGSGNKVVISKDYESLSITGANEFSIGSGNELTLLTSPKTSAANAYSGAGTIRSPDWRNFTPTVTASTGTITTVAAPAAGDCKYKLEGKTCHFDYTITITTNGTGAGTLQATLPFAAKKLGACCFGAVGSAAVKGLVQSGAARVDMQKYDGTYPGSDGAVIRVSGAFEIA